MLRKMIFGLATIALFCANPANAHVICISTQNETKCISGESADDLFKQISSMGLEAGEYLVLIDKSVANEMREKFKDNELIEDVSIKLFGRVDEKLKEQFKEMGGKSYYCLEIELN